MFFTLCDPRDVLCCGADRKQVTVGTRHTHRRETTRPWAGSLDVSLHVGINRSVDQHLVSRLEFLRLEDHVGRITPEALEVVDDNGFVDDVVSPHDRVI